MSNTVETLRYLGPQHAPRDIIDHVLESLFASLGATEASGLENIPQNGPLVIGYLPHSGWAARFVIDHFVRTVRPPPVWITREETKNQVPAALLGDRSYLFLNREQPAPDYFPTTTRILSHPQGCLATAFEGTRKGNNKENPDDLRTLGQFRTGIVQMAALGKAPILPVIALGEDQIIPRPEKAPFPPYGVIYELAKALVNPRKPNLRLAFLPPYVDHLREGYDRLSKAERSQHRKRHTAEMMRSVIPQLLRLEPNYPLGSYANLN